jgi:hypothetical protein
MSKTASILACGLAASIFSFNAQTFPGSSVPRSLASDIVEVRDCCGIGFHRNPWGACVPNGAPYGYVALSRLQPLRPQSLMINPVREVVADESRMYFTDELRRHSKIAYLI